MNGRLANAVRALALIAITMLLASPAEAQTTRSTVGQSLVPPAFPLERVQDSASSRSIFLPNGCRNRGTLR